MTRKACLVVLLLVGYTALIFVYIKFKDHLNLSHYMFLSSQVKVTPARRSSTGIYINPLPSKAAMEKMSLRGLKHLYHSYVVAPQVTCRKVQRMGLITEGGWELCEDPLYVPQRDNCLVYSYGIQYDFSFDDDMERFGCEVHSFDPSMLGTRDHLRGSSVHFHPTGIAGTNKTLQVKDEYGRVTTWHLYTLATHRSMYGHQPGKRKLDVVKMDVEGFEFESLMKSLDDGSLEDVRQLNFETHLADNKTSLQKHHYLKYLTLLRKVYESGFRIHTTHRNYVFSQFRSPVDGKYYVRCHEIHTVRVIDENTTHRNLP